MASSSIAVPGYKSAATGNGSTRGTIAVTAVDGFYVGCRVWLRSSTVAAQRYKIVKISSLTLSLRLDPPPTGGAQEYPKPNYGYSDLSAYLLADGAIVTQYPGQTAKIYDQFTKPTVIT